MSGKTGGANIRNFFQPKQPNQTQKTQPFKSNKIKIEFEPEATDPVRSLYRERSKKVNTESLDQKLGLSRKFEPRNNNPKQNSDNFTEHRNLSKRIYENHTTRDQSSNVNKIFENQFGQKSKASDRFRKSYNKQIKRIAGAGIIRNMETSDARLEQLEREGVAGGKMKSIKRTVIENHFRKRAGPVQLKKDQSAQNFVDINEDNKENPEQTGEAKEEQRKRLSQRRNDVIRLPYEPYSYQREASKKLFHSLRKGDENILFESPTGTGKTMVLLGTVLSFLEQQGRGMNRKIMNSAKGNLSYTNLG